MPAPRGRPVFRRSDFTLRRAALQRHQPDRTGVPRIGQYRSQGLYRFSGESRHPFPPCSLACCVVPGFVAPE